MCTIVSQWRTDCVLEASAIQFKVKQWYTDVTQILWYLLLFYYKMKFSFAGDFSTNAAAIPWVCSNTGYVAMHFEILLVPIICNIVRSCSS